MESVYRVLVRMHRKEGLDFSLCSTFNLDEYVGLAPGDPHSYRHYMNEHLFRHVNIDPRNTHLPNGQAPDLDAECRGYEAAIAKFGGIDLQLLGIGRAGHIGFNEPLSAFKSRTRVKALAPLTLQQNEEAFGGADQVPRRAITMGVGTILESRRCLLLATGAEEAAREVQSYLQQVFLAQGRAAAILATGNSQIKFLERLVKLGGVDWSKVTFFHMDEYLGIPAGHPASFRRCMRERVESLVEPK